jgi:hypothetical protein
VAQTKKKRRRKHRGTQGGKIDNRGRGARPRNRQEAQARARKQRGAKVDSPPTWRSAINRALIGAVIVAVIISLLQKNVALGIELGAFMLIFYIPMGYMVDNFMWRRRERARIRANQKDK